jgi:long-subunit fatty acid transport protein
MKSYLALTVIALLLTGFVKAQKNSNPIFGQFVDISFGIGNNQSSLVAGYFHNWILNRYKKMKLPKSFSGKSKGSSFFLGTGVRLTSNFGKGSLYTSAPSSLARDVNKTDTLFTSNPIIVGINVLINLGYNITSKLQAGFNIDLIGFSVGSKSEPRLIQNPVGYLLGDAKPTGLNILLIGNRDRGTLNSEFYARYNIANRFGVKLAYQYLFTELTTNTKVQTLPVQNDRFRNKARLFSIGVSYYF